MSDRKFLSSVEALGLDRPRGEPEPMLRQQDPRLAAALLRWNSLILLCLKRGTAGLTAAELLGELQNLRGAPPDFDEVYLTLKHLEGQGAVAQQAGRYSLTRLGQAMA